MSILIGQFTNYNFFKLSTHFVKENNVFKLYKLVGEFLKTAFSLITFN